VCSRHASRGHSTVLSTRALTTDSCSNLGASTANHHALVRRTAPSIPFAPPGPAGQLGVVSGAEHDVPGLQNVESKHSEPALFRVRFGSGYQRRSRRSDAARPAVWDPCSLGSSPRVRVVGNKVIGATRCFLTIESRVLLAVLATEWRRIIPDFWTDCRVRARSAPSGREWITGVVGRMIALQPPRRPHPLPEPGCRFNSVSTRPRHRISLFKGGTPGVGHAQLPSEERRFCGTACLCHPLPMLPSSPRLDFSRASLEGRGDLPHPFPSLPAIGRDGNVAQI
jgi:hypothetical protein